MKILRVRRGFTTNSSGSAEWIPPDSEQIEPPGSSGTNDGAATQQTAPGGLTVTNGAPSRQTAPNSKYASNGAIIGGIFGLLISLFFLEKWFRKLWKKFRGSPDEH